MFGYVVPKKCELKVREFNLYRAYYCSVCRELKNLGPFAKATLNYDFTFMALVAAAVSNDQSDLYKGRCTTNPLSTKAMIKQNDFLKLTAVASILSVKYKLVDNINDEDFFGKLKAYIMYLGLYLSFKKASNLHPEIDRLIKECMNNQNAIEKQNETSVDKVAEPTSFCLGKIFEMLSDDLDQKRILFRLGYYTGKFVYCSDMLDDLVDDIKNSCYNPLKLENNLSTASSEQQITDIINDYRPQLNILICEIAKAYNLLEIKNLNSIIENIIFLGLTDSVTDIGLKKKGNKFNAQPI